MILSVVGWVCNKRFVWYLGWVWVGRVVVAYMVGKGMGYRGYIHIDERYICYELIPPTTLKLTSSTIILPLQFLSMSSAVLRSYFKLWFCLLFFSLACLVTFLPSLNTIY